MATLLRADNTCEAVVPANGKHFTLTEMQTLVGGYIQIVNTFNGAWLVMDEEGKLKHKPRNAEATRLYQYGKHDPVCGDVLLFTHFFEMNGPGDDDE